MSVKSLNPARVSPWDETTTERLRLMHAAGQLTATEMAKVLGKGLSREAICGKLNRLGLKCKREAVLEMRERKSVVVWPPERVANLHRLWKAGMPINDIAKELRASTTSVTAKAASEGLPSRNRLTPQSVRAKALGARPTALKPGEFRQPGPNSGLLIDLRRDQCRMFTGDPMLPSVTTLFCGEPVEGEGKPYCLRCAMLAFAPAKAA